MIFRQAIDIVLEKEGGYIFDPDDPGGETNFGISKRQYPDLDIKNLSIGHARMIYERDYWNKVQAMALPEDFRLIMVDCAVNQGVKASILMLQDLVGAKKDGVLGKKTLEACNMYHYSFGATIMRNEYAKLRVLRYIKTKNFKKYGKGWISRVFDVLKASEEALSF